MSGQGDHSSLTMSFDEILKACRNYDPSSGQRGPNKLAEYVQQHSPQAQPTLLRNLLFTDVTSRRKAGEAPQSEEYIEALPEHANLIRSVFLETTSVAFSKSVMSDTTGLGTAGEGSNAYAATSGLPTSERLGNYRLIRQLGRGGMGLVFEAEHLQRKHHVALKTLPAVDGATLHAFKQEFRRMAEMNHPHVVGLHSLEEDHGHWYFTMDLVNGTDFLSYVRPNGKLDENRLRAVFPQLVSAILRLHGDNLIHRDLKPSNVMVDHDGNVIVLDFGLAYRRQATNGVSVDGLKGTIPYMAPEQTLDGSVTGAADWYSIGIMLYEAISGNRPFEGLSDVDQIVKKRQTSAPKLPPDSHPLADLIVLTNGLVEKDPANRPDPLAIARSVSESVDVVAVTAQNSGTAGNLVGRAAQLRNLSSTYKRILQEETPEMVFVSGRSGEGKTALVDYFLQDLRQRNTHFVQLSGRCYDRESVPFKALDSLIDALANYLCRLPQAEAALLMPDEIAFLAHLFPVLKRVSAVDKLAGNLNRSLDQTQVRTRAFAGLRSLLKRICVHSPVIMFADDLQWGDADSAQALYEILSPPEAPPVMFIGSYRCEETDTSAFLVKWQELTAEDSGIPRSDVKVSALTIEQCVQLAIQTLGEDSERLRTIAIEFASQTGGNALLLTELLSCFDANSESLQAMPISDVIDVKLGRLPDEAVRILETIAVSGRSIELDELAIAATAQEEASSVVTHMRSEKLVRLIGDENSSRVDTFHDKIRETVLSNLSAERKQSLHGSLASAILDSPARYSGDSGQPSKSNHTANESVTLSSDLPDSPDHRIAERVFDLSYHFDGAGDRENAFKFSLLAAKQAASQFSHRVAADHFAVARRNVPDDPKHRFVVAEGEGRALTLLGEYDQAQSTLDGAIDFTDDDVEKARILGMLAEIFHKQGRIREGIDYYARALRKLGYFVPRSRWLMIAALGYESAVQVLHTYLPKWVYRRAVPLNPVQELAVELANRKSIVSYYSDVPRMVWAHLKGMNVAETREPSKELAYSYGLHPAPAAAVGLARRGPRYSDHAIEYAVKSGDLLTEGHCYTMRSMACFASGMHVEGIAEGQRAVECLTKAGDPYLAFIAEVHISYSSTRNGQFEIAIETAANAFERSIRLGERASLAALLHAIAFATRGKFPFRELRACYEVDPSDNFSYCMSQMSEGVWHFHAGRYPEAIEAFEKSWKRTTKELILIPYFVEGMALLTTTLRIHATALPAGAKKERDACLKRWRSLLRQLAVLSRVYVYLRPHYLREAGMACMLSGKPKKALARFEASIKLAEKGGDVMEHTLSSLECGKVEVELGIPGGQDRINTANHVIKQSETAIEKQIALSFG